MIQLIGAGTIGKSGQVTIPVHSSDGDAVIDGMCYG